MTTEIRLKRVKGGFAASDHASAEAIQAVKIGSVHTVQLRLCRNPQRHRLYWAVLNKLIEGGSAYTTEGLHAFFRTHLGYTREIKMPVGTRVELLSISFNAMNEAEFSAYINGVLKLIRESILPKLPEGDWQHEFVDMIGDQ